MIASSAVTLGRSRQRPSLVSRRTKKYESRSAALPSGYERHAASVKLSPACSGLNRNGALPWTPEREVPAAVHLKEYSCRKNWLYRRARKRDASPFWKKDS